MFGECRHHVVESRVSLPRGVRGGDAGELDGCARIRPSFVYVHSMFSARRIPVTHAIVAGLLQVNPLGRSMVWVPRVSRATRARALV